MNTHLLCFKSDLKFFVKNSLKKILGINIQKAPKADALISSKVSISKIKKLIKQKGLAVADGQVLWFYTAYERGDHDPLTNFALDYILKNFNKDSKLLITGCGTGIMAFYLADNGFTNIKGFDYLPECVEVANEIAKLGGYKVNFYQDDGFNPKFINEKYDLITAMHWVFSAWMGNYGNKTLPQEQTSSDDFRAKLLIDFLEKYHPQLNPGGILILELTDSVVDYRIATDHYLGEFSKEIYPIRHSPEQVAKCAAQVGFEIMQKNLSVTYGHHPRTQYLLRKID